MRLRKAIGAEAENLLIDALSKRRIVAALGHAGHEFVAKMFQPALALPCRHGAPHLIGLAGREPGRNHGDLHHLLLKDRHATGALQHRPQRRVVGQVGHFLPLPGLEERVHHAP